MHGRVVALAAAIIVMPFPLVLWGSGQPNEGDFSFQTYVFALDVALAALVLLSIRPFADRLRHRTIGLATAAAGLLLVALAVALAFNPTGRGLLHLLRLAGIVAAADALASLRDPVDRTVTVGALVATTASQAVVAVLQRLNGGDPIGLAGLGEQDMPFTLILGAPATFGTMVHAYTLAALGAVTVGICVAGALRGAIPRGLALAGVIAGSVPMAITYSRMSVIAAVAVAIVLGMSLRRRHPERRLAGRLLVVMAVALLVPALVAPGPWLGRVTQSTSGDADDVSTGRISLMRQAVALFADQPLTGVGPGHYSFAVRDDPDVRKLDSRSVVLPVHSVPLLLAAEGGALAVLALLACALALAWQARRGGAAAAAVVLSLVPFLLLDHLNWTFPQGLLILGLWLGTIDGVAGGWASASTERVNDRNRSEGGQPADDAVQRAKRFSGRRR